MSPDAEPPTTSPAEVDRLRARVAELEHELGTAKAQSAGTRTERVPRNRWRSVTATVLITLGCLLAPFAVTAVWASQEVSSTERYVETVSPLAEDPAVQEAVTNRVTAAIFTSLDVEALVTEAVSRLEEQGLPPQVSGRLEGLAGPIAGGVEGFTRDQVAKIVASPQFADAWDAANRVAHEQVVAVLSGEQGGAVSAQGDEVVVNLAPFVAQVKERLVAEGFSLAANIPEVTTSVTIFQSDQMTRVQRGYRLLESLGSWLPVIALALIGLGVYVAKGHRRALVGAGLGVTGAMLALGVVLALGRTAYLNGLPETVSQEAAASVFDTVVRFLRDGLRATLVAALVVAAIAFLSGASVTAVRTRGALTGGIGRMRGQAESAGLRTGPVGTWVYTNRRWLRVGIAGLAAAVITFWTNPTVAVVLWVAALAVLAVAVVEFLARPPQPVAAGQMAGSDAGDELVVSGSGAHASTLPRQTGTPVGTAGGRREE